MANLKVDLSLDDGGLKQQIQQDKQAVSDFGKTVGDQAANFTKVVGSITNYKRKLSELTKEVVSLEMSYKSLSDEQKKSDFGQALSQQLAQAKERASQFRDQIADTNAEIKNLSSDSFKSDVFASGISTVSTSMQALISVTQLAGGETKNLEKAVSQLIVIQTTAAASIKVINALQQQSALMLGVRKIQEMALTASINLRTAAESRGVVVTKAATAASAALNAVSKANPYVLLATAILAVGTAVYAYVKATEKAESVDTERETQLKKLTEMHNHMAEKVGGSVGDVLGKYKALQKQWADLRTEHEKMQFLQDNQSAF